MVIVQVRDFREFIAEVLSKRIEDDRDCRNIRIVGGNWATVQRPDGLLALSEEGEIFPVRTMEPLVLGFLGVYQAYDFKGTPIAAVYSYDTKPFRTMEFYPEDLLNLPIVEEMGLSEFVKKGA